jgi:probable phosphoglycerate mutase
MAGSTSPTLRLFIVRHGETDDNLNQIIQVPSAEHSRRVHCTSLTHPFCACRTQGHIDTPLNGRGELQTRAAQDALADVAFDACRSSDLSRASKTAEIILAGQPSAITAKLDARGREKVTLC